MKTEKCGAAPKVNLAAKFHLVHICALMWLYQINAHEHTHILLKHHLISILYHSTCFNPQRAILKSTIGTFQQEGQQNESPDVEFTLMSSVYCVTC